AYGIWRGRRRHGRRQEDWQHEDDKAGRQAGHPNHGQVGDDRTEIRTSVFDRSRSLIRALPCLIAGVLGTSALVAAERPVLTHPASFTAKAPDTFTTTARSPGSGPRHSAG